MEPQPDWRNGTTAPPGEAAVQHTPEKATQTPFKRSLNSNNWRIKSDDAEVAASPSPSRNGGGTWSPRRGESTPSVTEGRRLYVGNMPYMAKAADVEALFVERQFAVERIDMSIDPFTGRNPSYCFVDLITKEQAERALVELDAVELLGRPLKIGPGVARKSGSSTPSKPTGTWGPSPSRLGQGLGDRSNVNGKPPAQPVFNRWERPESDAKQHWDGQVGKRLYVGGLPRFQDQATAEGDVKTFFEGFNLEAVSKVISPHESKLTQPGDHYYLFVDLSDADEAQAAREKLHGQVGPWGTPTKVNIANGRARKPEERENWEKKGMDLS